MSDQDHQDDAPTVEAERVDPSTTDVSKLDDSLPSTVIALPMNQRPVFPTMMLPLMVPAGRLADTVQQAIKHHHGHVAFFLTRQQLDDHDHYKTEDLYEIGAIARITKHQVNDEGAVQIFAQVQARFRRTNTVADGPLVVVQGDLIKPAVDAADPEVRALAMAIVTALKDLVQHNPVFADEIKLVLANYNNIDGPGRLSDLAASLTTAKREEIQDILETFDVRERMEKVLSLLARESEITQLKSKITNQINEKVSEHQRRFFLNEQLKAIKQELGLETDEKSLELGRLRERFEAKQQRMTDEIREVVEEELRKLSLLEPSSSEYGVSRNRLEWLVDIPWGDYSDDMLELNTIRTGLDQDHYGMDDVKKRIVEFCAVRKLNNDQGGGIIALAGPPGTGKTSIGASIAKQMGRKFFRFSLGGMRDEAEIKGHRRTYVGALPGKIAQAIRRCGTMNPVILLDEIDKLSHGIQGDPASALLEVLDPEQNGTFLDHYLDVRLDLSKVLFVCTANDISGIPEPLHDRMEVIRLPGYIDAEKVQIATSYLVPKQRSVHGLSTRDISFAKGALQQLTRSYAREAGVRQLERLIGKICRKVATQKAEDEQAFSKISIKKDNLVSYVGKPFMSDDELMANATPGVVTGLAWTAMGGATLEIEAVAVPAEKGGFQLSGQLGDVMQESARLARTYLQSRATHFGLEPSWFDQRLIHVHVPAGATPKDGPSAGITMATAMLSLAKGKAPKRKLGMTGELTLTGRVYPIGGVREKLVAARRAGLKTLIFPQANERDIAELPDFLKQGLAIHFVSHIDDVLQLAGLI
jgi:ATP-dependent Lon protease